MGVAHGRCTGDVQPTICTQAGGWPYCYCSADCKQRHSGVRPVSCERRHSSGSRGLAFCASQPDALQDPRPSRGNCAGHELAADFTNSGAIELPISMEDRHFWKPPGKNGGLPVRILLILLVKQRITNQCRLLKAFLITSPL